MVMPCSLYSALEMQKRGREETLDRMLAPTQAESFLLSKGVVLTLASSPTVFCISAFTLSANPSIKLLPPTISTLSQSFCLISSSDSSMALFTISWRGSYLGWVLVRVLKNMSGISLRLMRIEVLSGRMYSRVVQLGLLQILLKTYSLIYLKRRRWWQSWKDLVELPCGTVFLRPSLFSTQFLIQLVRALPAASDLLLVLPKVNPSCTTVAVVRLSPQSSTTDVVLPAAKVLSTGTLLNRTPWQPNLSKNSSHIFSLSFLPDPLPSVTMIVVYSSCNSSALTSVDTNLSYVSKSRKLPCAQMSQISRSARGARIDSPMSALEWMCSSCMCEETEPMAVGRVCLGLQSPPQPMRVQQVPMSRMKKSCLLEPICVQLLITNPGLSSLLSQITKQAQSSVEFVVPSLPCVRDLFHFFPLLAGVVLGVHS